MDDGAWHRLGMYFGLLEDPDSEALEGAEHLDFRARARAWTLQTAIGAVFFFALMLIVHLVNGGDTDPGALLLRALRFFGVAWSVGLLVIGVERWWRQSG
jgi:hypothetical protein